MNPENSHVAERPPDDLHHKKRAHNHPSWLNSPSTYLLIGAAAAAYLYLFVRVQWRIGDEGDMVNGALAVTRGLVPYRDFYDLRGPLSFYWLGLFFKLFGATWHVARVHLLLTGAATTVFVYHLTRRVVHGALALLPCAYVTVLSIPLWAAPHHHWDSNLFALGAVTAFFGWQDSRRHIALATAGVLAGLTSCVIYQKGGLLLISFMAILVISHRYFIRDRSLLASVGTLLAGYTTVGLIVLVWFIHLGALSDFFSATIATPVNSYVDANRLPYAYSLTSTAFQMLSFRRLSPALVVANAEVCLLPFAVIAAAPFLVLVMLAVRTSTAPATIRRLSVIAYCTIGFALWFSEFHRRDIMHLIYGCPVLAIALCVLWDAVDRRPVVRAFVPWTATLSLALLAVNLGVYAAAADVRIMTRRGEIVMPHDDAALRFLLSDQVAAGDYVFVYPYYSEYYFLADVRNPTRFGEMLYGPGSEPYFKEAIAAVEAKHVRYVLWDTVVSGENLTKWFPAYREPPRDEQLMERYFESHYDEVTILNGFRLLKRKN
jgi:hypothetical protein